MTSDNLQAQIDKVRAQVQTDGYPVSIGEWISIYEKGELDIHPEFQRFFRWSDEQKSRLIESILLGIPVPQVFVTQREDGIWDVVDGLQRLSTIFEFAGILKSEKGEDVPPLVLKGTKYLPALSGKRWENEENPDGALSPTQRLIIKRAKIGVSIILRESDAATKYELFQRLNSGGTQLSDQELRNSIIVMLNRDFFAWLENLATNTQFQETIALSDRALDERYDLELLVRFLVFRKATDSEMRNLGDLGDYLTESIAKMAQDSGFDRTEAEDAFKSTFALLSSQLGSDAFRRYDKSRKRFSGGFSVSAYEAVALGVAHNLDALVSNQSSLVERVQEMWYNPEFYNNSGSGVRASSRVPKIVPLGRKLFSL